MRPGMRYDDFTQRLRKYTRTSLLSSGTNVGWLAWNTSEKLRGKNFNAWQDAHLSRAFAGRVTAIAAAEANEHRNAIAGTQDIVRLVHEFLAILPSSRFRVIPRGAIARTRDRAPASGSSHCDSRAHVG
jgi:hypothetical protein